MALRLLSILLALGCACAAPSSINEEPAKSIVTPQVEDTDDLKTAASETHVRRYSNYGYNPAAGYNNGITGYGLLDGGKYYGNYNGYNPGYAGYSGYNNGYSGYNGYGGYGGYGGNSGLDSYYGYNSPYYRGADHLGWGYYGKRAGYGSIYNNAITPSLVTGYRGYTRR